MGAGIGAFDLGVILILLISGLLAMVRGFTREVLAIGAWVGAVFGALWLFPWASLQVRPHVRPDVLADGVAGFASFVGILVILTMVSSYVGAKVRESAVGAVDRSLGFAFGVVRGALVVCVLFLVFSVIVGEKSRPDWVQQAELRPLVEAGSEALRSMVPDRVKSETEKARETGEKLMEGAGKAKKTLEEMEKLQKQLPEGTLPGAPAPEGNPPANSPPTNAPPTNAMPPQQGGQAPGQTGNPAGDKAQETGYNATTRNQLNQLTRTTEGN